MNFKTNKEMNQHNEITLLKLQLQQYKSIVKKVDPDNLSECEVLVWCDAGLILGSIFIDLKNARLKVDNYYGIFANPTHYIEQKDLIKLFK